MKKALIGLAIGAIFFAGCSDDKKTASVEQKAPVATTQEKSTLLNTATQEASKVVEQAKESATVIAQEVKKEAAPVVEAVKTEVISATTKVSNEIEQKVDAVAQAMTPQSNKGAELFVKCAACHGQKAEKKALGTSQIIKGWEAEKVITSLKGYKNKTYGGNMKTIMIGQVSTLSDEDIEALAQHISSL